MKFSSMAYLAMALGWCVAAPAAFAQSDQRPPPDHSSPPPEAHPAVHPAPSHVEVHHTQVQVHHTQVQVTRTQVQVSRPPVRQAEGSRPRWSNGAHYTGGRAVFTDWNRYHVRQPPPGYEWVQDDDQLVLIEINTGIISDVFIIP